MAKTPYLHSIAEPHMTGPLISAVLLHVAVVTLMIVGVPFMSKDVVVIQDAIAVEFISAEEHEDEPPPEQSARTVRERPAYNTEPPPRVVPRPSPQDSEPPPRPAAPERPPEPEPAPAPEPEVAEVTDAPAPPLPAKRPPPPPPKAEPEPEPEPEVAEKVEEPPAEPPAPQQDFSSVLKNLLPDEPATQAQEAEQDNEGVQTAEQASRFAPRMSYSELDALRMQLSQCWKLMSGARYAENLVVEVRLTINRDRSVQNAQVVDRMRYNTDRFFRAAAESALRAVHNPHCNPLDLPQDKYELWRVMTVSFDPRQML